MNNEPVAWMYNYENFPDSFVVCRARKSDQDIPLYTHQYERPHNTVLVPCDKLAEMQAEINALRKEAALQRLSDFTQEAECKHGVDDGACKECYQEATEPVAWFYAYPDDIEEKFLCSNSELIETMKKKGYTLTPLYTHPVKELTDEEIRGVADEVFSKYKNWHHYQIDFARAILRKASEK